MNQNDNDKMLLFIVYSIMVLFSGILLVHMYFTNESKKEAKLISESYQYDEYIMFSNLTTLKIQSEAFRIISEGKYEN